MNQLFLVFVFLFTASLSNAQEAITLKEFGKSSLVMVSQRSDKSTFPAWFEETDSIITINRKKDTIVTEFYSTYANRLNKTGRGKRSTIFKKGEIKVEINDTLTTHINRNKAEFEGVLGGKKGLIIKRLLPSSSEMIPAPEKYFLKNDSTYFLVYRPELFCIEVEMNPTYLKNRMLGSLFNEICKSESGTTEYEPLNRNMQIGDTLQILFKQRSLNIEKGLMEFNATHLLTVSIINKTTNSDLIEFEYFSSMTEIQSGTQYNFFKGKLQYYPEGIALDYFIYIKDELVERNLLIQPSSSPLRSHPYYPSIDLVGAQIEASWQERVPVGDIRLSKTCYWNSVNSSRLNFIPTFPIAWRDQGDTYIGDPCFVKVNGQKKGELYEIKENTDLHFSRIEQTRDSVFIYINSPRKTNVGLDFKAFDKEIEIKKSHGLSTGINLIALSKSSFRIDYTADLMLYELVNQERVIKQSFRYTEQQNL